MSSIVLQIAISKSRLVLKHGDGSHDEKSHGNRGGSGFLDIKDVPGHIKISDLPSGDGGFLSTPKKIPRDGYIDLFHVTETESIASILSSGKISNEGIGSNNLQGYTSGVIGVYGWSSLNRAVAEVSRASEQLGVSRSHFSIFKIRVPVFDGRLVPDEDTGTKDWKKSYIDGSVALKGGADMDDVVELYTSLRTRRR